MLEVLGLPMSTWTQQIQPKIDIGATQKSGRILWVHVPTVFRFVRERDKAAAVKPQSAEADGSIEAKRIIDTKLAELKLRQQLGELVPIDEIQPMLAHFAHRFSTLAEYIGRKPGGADTQRRMNEIIDELIGRLNGEPEEADASDSRDERE